MGQETKPKLKLMIVDDELDNLDLLYRTFRRDFEVVQATSAIAALKILDQQGEMAIIISDQRMPEMLGTEFLSKTVDRFPDTIRIVLTGYTDVEDLVDAINAGKVFKYITKPWKPAQLQVVVEQAAETYTVLKQRTADLQRALRRESLFNAVTTAIRESLDYRSMLQTIVETLGQTFDASCCVLHPVEENSIVAQSSLYCSPECVAMNGDRDHQDPIVQAVLHTRKTQVSQLGKDADMRLVVPLAYQQDLLAILSFYRGGDQQTGADSSRNPWSKEDIQLLEGVAEQAALA
ncbi:MAG: response regulator, partial [Phormidesmis sp. CAN_BIN44]|nr:response regulator [Phormidesmis sp. CAN_BIN44]